jgi:hypothetical protein
MIAVIVAAVAGVLGLLILRDVNNDDTPSAGTGNNSVPQRTTVPGGSGGSTTVAGSGSPTTTSAPVRSGATVVVGNASGVGGAAGNLTDALDSRGYTTGTPSNANEKRTTTVVLAKAGDPAAAAVASTLLRDLGLTGTVQPIPATNPLKEPTTATVIVLLGPDKANKPLAPINGATTTTTAGTGTTKAGATTTRASDTTDAGTDEDTDTST